MKPVSWDEDDEKDRGKKGGGGGGGVGWLRPKKQKSTTKVAAEEMSDGEVDAAKEVERKHRERLNELGMAPPSTSDPDTAGSGKTRAAARGVGTGSSSPSSPSSPSSSGGMNTFLQLLFSTVVHALVLAGCLLVLALAAVYVDANGLWPDAPLLPPLPPLPANAAQFRHEASKVASAWVGKMTDATEDMGATAAAAAERLKTAVVKTFESREEATETAREVARRMTTAATSFRDVLVAEFRRRT